MSHSSESSAPETSHSTPAEEQTAGSTSLLNRWADRLSYRVRLILGMCVVVGLTGLTISWLSNRTAHRTTEKMAASLFDEVSKHAVTHTSNYVLRAAPIVNAVHRLSQNGLDLDDSDQLARQLYAVYSSTPGLSWLNYGDEQGRFTGIYHDAEAGEIVVQQTHIVDGRTQMIEHTIADDGSWTFRRQHDDHGYDPRERPFYIRAKEAGELVWLRPYLFYDPVVPGISCSVPVYNAAAALQGVISVDFNLHELSDFVANLEVSPNSQFFIYTADHVLLAHPEFSSSGKLSASMDHLPEVDDVNDPLVHTLATQRSADTGSQDPFVFSKLSYQGENYLASTTRFPVGDQTWYIGAIAPASDFLGDIWFIRWIGLAVALVAIGVAVFLAALMARHVSRPVESLIAVMNQISSGDLDARADLGNCREFRHLSNTLNCMTGDLRDRLRLRHSLDVAMQVQQRLLPSEPPVIPGVDLAGHSTYCDETGGDYYDFLMVDQTTSGNVLVALGDVMGHGIAAALVMAGTRAVLRDRAPTDNGLSELMQRLNQLLVNDLDGSRFMTMYLAIVDRNTETLRWVSAGHDPALIYDPVTDEFEETGTGGLPLGILDTEEFVEESYGPLRNDQIVMVGTDGIWETHNAEGELFGKDRLRQAIRAAASGTAEDISQSIRDSLEQFRGECRPTDDMTFLIIKLQPVESELHPDAVLSTSS